MLFAPGRTLTSSTVVGVKPSADLQLIFAGSEVAEIYLAEFAGSQRLAPVVDRDPRVRDRRAGLIDDRHAKAGFNRPPVLREGRIERHGESRHCGETLKQKLSPLH